MTSALDGIRVLDVTDGVSGPFATMMLGSYGAEVIRIDSMRHLGFREYGSATRKSPDVLQSQDSADFCRVKGAELLTPGFSHFNLDKLSVALNLTKPDGRMLFKKLIKVSDVVLDNLSFGIMKSWGFDYQALCQIKSDIIVASLPSLGKGPHEHAG